MYACARDETTSKVRRAHWVRSWRLSGPREASTGSKAVPVTNKSFICAGP